MTTITQIKKYLQEITLDELIKNPEMVDGLKGIQSIISDFLSMINSKRIIENKI